MKHEYRAPHPADLKPSWPGQFELFSWLNHVATIPGVVLITTRKESGAPNACLHAWGLLAGEKDHYASVLAVPDYTHTYANILRENEWASTSRVSIGTRGASGPSGTAGRTWTRSPRPVSRRKKGAVRAPRIAECPVALECRLMWHQPLLPGSAWHLFAGRVELLALAEEVLDPDPVKRTQC